MFLVYPTTSYELQQLQQLQQLQELQELQMPPFAIVWTISSHKLKCSVVMLYLRVDVQQFAHCTPLCHSNTSSRCSNTLSAFFENPGDSTNVPAIVQTQKLHHNCQLMR